MKLNTLLVFAFVATILITVRAEEIREYFINKIERKLRSSKISKF